MKTLPRFAAIAALMVSTASFAGAANATTLIEFPFGGFSFHAAATYTGNVAGADTGQFALTNAPSVFSFDPGIGGAGIGVGEDSKFSFNAVTDQLATSSAGNTAGAILEQRGYHGTFSIIYTGPNGTALPPCLSGPCTNLLSGTFTGGVLLGHQGSHHAEESDGTSLVFQTLSMSSDFFDFSGVDGQSFSIAFDPTNPALNYNTGTHLISNFTAVGTGSGGFALAVPEASTWALMIMGFGGVGVMIRRRRQGAAFA